LPDCHISTAGFPVVWDVTQLFLFHVYQRFKAFNAFNLRVKQNIKILFSFFTSQVVQ